ncbi:sulfatase-like hydrolase/transferase [Candidatus Villigracilis saccharophilus]|uniref:sulfatase-like hydrolase/transferase n=1 Tax=Candidatus Villigracilis saccharophilus TaxID=3140684 RepID=UPI00313745A0|nr:sulfatase-like hydrolase/transferase [Anaerolineales bacterium]
MFRNKYQTRLIFLISVFATLALFIFEELFFNEPNTRFMAFAREKGATAYLIWLFTLISGLFLNIHWFWWSLRAKTAYRILYGVIFALGVFIQYGYWNVLHRLIQPTDIALLGITSTQAWVDSYKLYFSWYGLFIGIPYLIILYIFRGYKYSGWKEFSFSLIAIFILTVLTSHSGITFSAGTSFSESLHSLSVYLVDGINPVSRDTLSYHSQTVPKQNIVLIIDEGIRGDHLSINGYSRETTPWLDELKKQEKVYSWGIISSGATCSQLSNQLLITGIIPSQNNIKDVAHAPTIFQYARSAGYKSYYLDAQTNYFWNGLSPVDTEWIEWINISSLGITPDADINAANIIKETVGTSTGNFIVLNKRGVHFMYEDSYPQAATIWTPLPPGQNYIEFPDLVPNPYDNGVKYSVDGFFRELLTDVKSYRNTLYIYTSDHAQTLFENGMTWSHCNSSTIEASVPLLIFGDLSKAPDTSYKASHSNIFPTILDLMDIPKSEYKYKYNFSLLDHENQNMDRYFINGASNLILFSDANSQ